MSFERIHCQDPPRERIDVIEKNYIIEKSHINHTTIMDIIFNPPEEIKIEPPKIIEEIKPDEKSPSKKIMGRSKKIPSKSNKTTMANIQKKVS